jgi:hypothetical protein
MKGFDNAVRKILRRHKRNTEKYNPVNLAFIKCLASYLQIID